MMMSGYDSLTSQALRRLQKVDSDWDVVMASGRVFLTRGPATVMMSGYDRRRRGRGGDVVHDREQRQ